MNFLTRAALRTSPARIRPCKLGRRCHRDGSIADFRVENWQGLFAPAGTGKPIVEKIGRAVADVVRTPEVKSRMAAVGFEARGEGPVVVAELIQANLPKWSEVIRRSGLKLAE